MKCLYPAILSLAILCSVQGVPGPFTVTISIFQEIGIGEDVTCKVDITNHYDSNYYLLKRGTPLEDQYSPIYTVMFNGKPVPYEGILARRTPPTQDDYILIPAKSSLSETVDLSLTYGFRYPGKYSVQLITSLNYYIDNFKNSTTLVVSSNAEVFTLTKSNLQPKTTIAEMLSKNVSQEFVQIPAQTDAVVPPSFAGSGTSSDKSTATTAYTAAYNLLTKSASSVTGNPTLYTKWFGRSYYGSKDTVQGNYLDMKYAMGHYRYILYFHGTECGKDTYAYTYQGGSVIYLCDVYFKVHTIGYDSKMDTIVHEMSHAVAYTEDKAYSMQSSLDLAKNHPSMAINSADNYAYFAVEANQ